MKIIKRVLLVLVALVLAAVASLVLKFYVLSPKMREPLDVKAPTSPEAIERGRYLANHVAACMGCHSQIDEHLPGEPIHPGRIGSGRDFGEMPGFPGRMRSANLTPDAETGIGKVSDGVLLRAIREGIGRDGHVLFPFMPYPNYAKALSDADALAIIGYLRSLAPIKNQMEASTVDFPVKMFIRGVPAPVTAPLAAAPSESDPVARGNWLITAGNCHDCHDAFDDHHQPLAGKELSGGFEFKLPNGSVFAANISSDQATGIGAYSDDDLMRVLTDGVGKSGRKLYAMPWWYYSGQTEADKRAMIAALRKTAPVSNVVKAATIKP